MGFDAGGGGQVTRVSYGFRGRSLVARKTLDTGLVGLSAFDAGRRPLNTVLANVQGEVIFGKRRSWSPRNLEPAVRELLGLPVRDRE